MSVFIQKLKEPSLVDILAREMREKPIDERFVGMMSLTKKQIIALYALAYDKMERMAQRHEEALSTKDILIDELLEQLNEK